MAPRGRATQQSRESYFFHIEKDLTKFSSVYIAIYATSVDDVVYQILKPYIRFFDRDVPRSPSYGVYILQRIRFAWACSNVGDFNNRTNFLTLSLKQVYRYHKIHKAFLYLITDTQS